MKKPAAISRQNKAPISAKGYADTPRPVRARLKTNLKPGNAPASGRSEATPAQIRNRTPANPGGARSSSLTKRLEAWSKFREQYNPLRGLTLARAVSLLEDYNVGAMADLQWTYLHIEQTDADLLALVELGLSRLAEMDWDVVASEDADPAVAAAQTEYLREQFDRIANLEDAIEHLASARFRGFAHCEKIYGASGEIEELAIVDQWNAVRDGLKGGWRYNPEARSTIFSGLPAENDMPPERFVFREVKRPVNRIALIKFIRANLSEKDWDAFVEIYGIPSGVVFGPPNVPQGKEAEYESAAAQIAEGGSGYLPNGSSYTQNKAEAGGTPFKDRLDHLSEKLVLAGTAGKLTMLTDATGMGSGASDAHTKVFDSIASAEAGRISRIFTESLVKPWLAARFPGQKPVAYFRLAANEETDTSAIITDIAALAGAGFDLDPAQVEERTGWKVTKRAEPATPAGGSPFGGFGGFANRTAAAIRNRAAEAAPLDFDAALAAALALPEEAARRAALEKLSTELPALLADERALDATARLIEAGMAEALVTGASEKLQDVSTK